MVEPISAHNNKRGGFTMQWTKKELVQLWMNTDKRRDFLKNYKEWGIWLTVPELGLEYYKYELPDGSRILVMEYRRPNPYPRSNEESLQTFTIYYLWDSEYFNPCPSSEYTLTDLFKKLKAEYQKELRPVPAE